MKRCFACNGSGRTPGETEPLETVHGVCRSVRAKTWLKCVACDGTGKVAKPARPKVPVKPIVT